MNSALLLSVALLGLIGYSSAAVCTGVKARLLHFKYKPTNDACDIFGGACDSEFKLEYSWNDNFAIQEIAEVANTNDVYFASLASPKQLNGPFVAGKYITIKAFVVDVDTASKDDIGKFEFDYRIPASETERSTITRKAYADNGKWESEFVIEFEPQFQ